MIHILARNLIAFLTMGNGFMDEIPLKRYIDAIAFTVRPAIFEKKLCETVTFF